MHNAKEQWIQEVLTSVKNRADAPGNPYLHTRILARIDQGGFEPRGRQVSPKWILAAAAGFCILIMVNILSVSRHTKPAGGGSTDGIGQVVMEYGMNEQVY